MSFHVFNMYRRYAIELVCLLTVLLLLPMLASSATESGVFDPVHMTLSTLGIAVFIWSVSSLLLQANARISALVTATLLGAALLIRFTSGFLYDFSGRGFGSEFFIHMNRTALEVGYDHYRREIHVVLGLMLLAVAVTAWLVARRGKSSIRLSLYGFGFSSLLLYAGAVASPEILLAQAYWQYKWGQSTLDPQVERSRDALAEMLAPLRGSNVLPVDKRDLEARAPEEPYNLVMVYLESFNLMLTEQQRYPNLTPRLNRLKERLHSFDNIQSTGFFTMEGIANSQCGTLFSMEHANNSLLTPEGRAPTLPCLGDVLRAAGYHQVFLGGADLAFAGKGLFLRDHGYDRLLGWEHWAEQGYEQVGEWGLSDATLFDEAFDLIQRLRGADAPFNVTLLTLGMHLPGFVYDGCPEYSNEDDDIFLNAIHCTDALVGEFVDRLEAAGVLEDTLLFIQADHGVFASPGMDQLFGEQVADGRLLTLLSLPEALERRVGTRLNLDAPGSNVDTAATLIDLLDIRTNASFVLSRSHLHERDEKAYYITRRADFHDGRPVENSPAACADESATLGAAPFDACEKRQALAILSAVQSTYNDSVTPRTRICELAANVRIGPESRDFMVRWGNRILTDQFVHRGVKVRGGSAKGIYAVLLDQRDDVKHALFFGVDNDYDLDALEELLQTQEDAERLLLLRNVDLSSLDSGARARLPAAIADHDFVYGHVENGALRVDAQHTTNDAELKFYPASCRKGVASGDAVEKAPTG